MIAAAVTSGAVIGLTVGALLVAAVVVACACRPIREFFEGVDRG